MPLRAINRWVQELPWPVLIVALVCSLAVFSALRYRFDTQVINAVDGPALVVDGSLNASGNVTVSNYDLAREREVQRQQFVTGAVARCAEYRRQLESMARNAYFAPKFGLALAAERLFLPQSLEGLKKSEQRLDSLDSQAHVIVFGAKNSKLLDATEKAFGHVDDSDRRKARAADEAFERFKHQIIAEVDVYCALLRSLS